MVKVFHTSDNHLGMTFNRYPNNVRENLVEARIKSFKKMVETANEAQADIFVVAGDLFHSLSVSSKLVSQTASILRAFSGSCVLVLPGNHDCYTGSEKIWDIFEETSSDETILLKEFRPYKLDDYGLEVTIYPAFCQSKHSKENNLSWMPTQMDSSRLNIGIAHGSFEGITPDLEGVYFYMSKAELESVPVDLWLLGHTHVPYPQAMKTDENRIFNAGTHEADGMNYRYEGSCFLIELSKDKVASKRLLVGENRFFDLKASVNSKEDLEDFLKSYACNNVLLRLTLSGYMDREDFENRYEIYRKLSKDFLYLEIRDDDLSLKFTKDDLDEKFVAGSLPYKLLDILLEKSDAETVQLAYDLLMEAKDDN